MNVFSIISPIDGAEKSFETAMESMKRSITLMESPDRPFRKTSPKLGWNVSTDTFRSKAHRELFRILTCGRIKRIFAGLRSYPLGKVRDLLRPGRHYNSHSTSATFAKLSSRNQFHPVETDTNFMIKGKAASRKGASSFVTERTCGSFDREIESVQ